jgi:hypothetical protein
VLYGARPHPSRSRPGLHLVSEFSFKAVSQATASKMFVSWHDVRQNIQVAETVGEAESR